MTAGRWTEADYDGLSWHDVHVHGLRIREGDYGSGELELDIDFIVRWICGADGSATFEVAPARLTFRTVTDLRIEIDYKAATAGLVPFSIDRLEWAREEIVAPSNWTIALNWPKGSITFQSEGFEQVLVGPSVVTPGQRLTADERRVRQNDAKG